MSSLHEEWRPVPGHDGHEVSNLGRVRSLDRTLTFKCRWGHVVNRNHAGRILQPYTNKDGYLATKLAKKGKLYLVHQLVSMTYIGPRPDGLVVNHKNGNKKDNRPSNLEYVTPEENVRHAHRTGLVQIKGEQNWFASISNDDARMMADLFANGGTISDAMRRFGVKRGVAEKIRRGESWRSVVKTGYVARGHKRLSQADIQNIASLYKSGTKQADIVRETGIPQSTVSRIMRNAKSADTLQ